MPAQGIKAWSMGGAFIGLADDWTATYYNPAGLAFLEGKVFGVAALRAEHTFTDRDSLANVDLEDFQPEKGDAFLRIYSTEPGQFLKEKSHAHANLLNMGGYFPMGPYTVGVAMYNPLGNSIDVDSHAFDEANDAKINATYFTRFFVLSQNTSIARRVTPKLALGIGLNIAYSEMELDVDKTYKSKASPDLDYDFDLETTQRGIGAEGVIGIMYKLSSKLSLGGVYRSGSMVQMRGEADSHHTAFDADEESDLKRIFPQPATWGLGLAYKPTLKLTLVADFQRTEWGNMKLDINYEDEGLLLTDINKSMHWRASDRYRWGMEYKVNEKLALRAGFFIDKRALPADASGLTLITDVDSKEGTLGFSYLYKNCLIEFMGGKRWSKEELNGSDKSLEVFQFMLAVTHKF